MNEGYIKLFRQMIAWEWYLDTNVKCLFIHCLLKANWEDKNFKGKVIPRGSFLTSYDILSKELKLSVKQIRVALKKLNGTNEVASEKMLNGTLITVLNYESYQSDGKQEDTQGANEGQTEGKRRATTNNKKNIKKLKKYKLDDFIPLIHSFTSNEILREKITKFVEFRKSINKQLHVETFNEWLDELKGLSSDELIQIKIVSKSLANGWQGIFAITSPKQGGKKDVLPDYYADAKNGEVDNLDEKVTLEEINALQENLKSLGG
ncbi:MAG: hypothetical protein RR598_10825 [Anaerorhabdus sp.]